MANSTRVKQIKAKRRADLFYDFFDTASDAFIEGLELYGKENERSKNAVLTEVNLLPELSNLIRDEESLANYEKMSEELANKASRNTETAPYAAYIRGLSANYREDYDTYSTEMERGAKIIDAPDFLDTQKEFLDLEKSIKGMKSEDGKTPKYEGTLDYLVKKNDEINSIMGRIENVSKKTQFRYNKHAKYTDQEIGEKISSYQKRLSVAVQAAIGNGEITPQEAEFIMLGDVKAYKEAKRNKVKLLDSQYKMINNSQKTIGSQLQRLQLKGIKDSDAPDLARMFKTEFVAQGSDEVMDTELDGLSIKQMIEDLEAKNKSLYTAKVRTMSSYKAWEGRPMFDAPKATPSELGDLMQNIMIDDGKDINDPLGKPEKKKAPKLTYDPAMGDTLVVRNRARVKKYKISPRQLGDLEDQWSGENSGETFDVWLDKVFKPAGLDADIEKMWKSLSKEDKAKYRSLANFKKNWK